MRRLVAAPPSRVFQAPRRNRFGHARARDIALQGPAYAAGDTVTEPGLVQLFKLEAGPAESEGHASSRVISVPPATIEEGAARTAASTAAPALGATVTAKAGSSIYGPGASKENDWEEF